MFHIVTLSKFYENVTYDLARLPDSTPESFDRENERHRPRPNSPAVHVACVRHKLVWLLIHNDGLLSC